MHLEANMEPSPRPRDRAAERRERQRYEILEGVYQRTGENCETPVSGLQVGQERGLRREETFRCVQHLAQRGYLFYVGAGPRVCITPRGIRYLNQESGRRRSVRDERSVPPGTR